MIEPRTLLLAGMLGLFGLCGCGSGLGVDPVPPPPSSPPPVASQQGSVMVTPAYAAIGVGKTQVFHGTINAAAGGSLVWSVNGVAGGNASVGTVDASGNYTAPATLPNSLSANFTVTAALSSSPTANFATSVVSVIVSGFAVPTKNPQVADYRIYLPMSGTAYIEFGPTTAYGFPTSTQTTPTANGGLIDTQVAGMMGSSNYHMRAQVTLADGATYTDPDQPFTTGKPPATATVTTTTTAGATPEPGIELFDTLQPHENTQAFATDLQGNVIWTYTAPDADSIDLVQPIKPLPNGHFLVQIAYLSSVTLKQGAASVIPPGTLDEVREVDLVGNTIRSVTLASIQPQLAALGYGSMQLGSLHHDVLALPNGHMVLLASQTQTVAVAGYSSPVAVLGDALIDVDQNGKADWVWDAFQHLDVNRHPYEFPDWLHSNSLLYTDDGNLLLSIRHQNWIVKIDFENGTGSGNVIWRLGHQGNFTLEGATAPTGWFYAQHDPSFFTTNSTGTFRLGVMDNGNDRVNSSGVVCGQLGGTPCYSSAQVYEIDESTMTATQLDNYELQQGGSPVYSFFGGDVALLGNGDMETDFCAMPTGSVIQELNGAFGSQQVVWQATTPNTNQFRTLRLGSLYPGVTW